MFDRATHPLVGTEATFMRRGFSPYDVSHAHDDENTVLVNGDPVDIISAWTRPYLPPTAPILFYVRSRNTGKGTHVTEDDLKTFSFDTEVDSDDFYDDEDWRL